MFQQNVTLGPGSGTFTEHTLEIFIMLAGAFLIGLWLGWLLWSKFKREAEKLALENSSLSAGMEALRNELNTAKTKLSTLESESINYSAQVASLNRNNANLRDRIGELELELSLLNERNRQVETELGLSFEGEGQDVHLEITGAADQPNPATETAAQDPETDSNYTEHIEPTEDSTPSEAIDLEVNTPDAPEEDDKLELLVPPVVVSHFSPVAETPEEKPTEPVVTDPVLKNEEILIAVPTEKDDLTVVEGIGPKIQMLLNQYGIYSYRQLATTDVARLKEILQAAGPQLAMHDPGTWPSQANLAANDEWDSLKSIQGFLKGGKKPT